MRARFVLGFALVLSTASFACSSSSDSGTPQDTGVVVTDSGAHDTNTHADTTPADTAPMGCWIGHPTDTSAQSCDVCSFDKCKSQWQAAYGANYLSDDFTGGACKDNATCNCACGEHDAICQENCNVSTITTACDAAKQAIIDCQQTTCESTCTINNPDSGTETGTSDASSDGG